MLKQITSKKFYKKQHNVNCSLSVVQIYGKYHTLFINKQDDCVFGVEFDGNYFVVRKKYKLNRFFIWDVLHVTFENTACFVDH